MENKESEAKNELFMLKIKKYQKKNTFSQKRYKFFNIKRL